LNRLFVKQEEGGERRIEYPISNKEYPMKKFGKSETTPAGGRAKALDIGYSLLVVGYSKGGEAGEEETESDNFK